MAVSSIIMQAKDNLSMEQRRLFFMCLRQVYTHCWPTNGKFVIDPGKYATLFNVRPKTAQENIRQGLGEFYATKGDRSTAFLEFTEEVAEENDLEDVIMPWISSIRKKRKRGDYTLALNPELRPYLEPIINELQFTLLQEDDLYKMTSDYSQKLFMSFCQFRDTGIYYISHKNLVNTWGVPVTYQKSPAHVKKYVIEKAVKEIKTKSVMVKRINVDIRRGPRNRAEGYVFKFAKF